MYESHGQSVLQNLNDDVLFHIFELSRPNGGLRSLSATCRSFRFATMHVLFRRCIVVIRKPITEEFIPPSLWPFIRSLVLDDIECEYFHLRQVDIIKVRGCELGLFCHAMHPPTLRNALQSMPLLRSVELTFHESFRRKDHILPWETLEAILSVPHLSEIIISSLRLYHINLHPQDMLSSPSASLTSFQYKPMENCWQWIERSEHPERDILTLILERFHRTLETLVLPSDITPFSVLSSHSWPRMRNLTLNGKSPPDVSQPIVSLLVGMPGLRVLDFDLALKPDGERRQMWPTGYAACFPCPELEELSVSFPDPSDMIFANLPRSVCRLTLRCRPHYFMSKWRRGGWECPMPLASEMLEMLRQLDLPEMEHLLVEYRADDVDLELLRHVAVAFPELKFLEIHRIRQSDDIPVSEMCGIIASLQKLRVLRLHLDLPEAPDRLLTRTGTVIIPEDGIAAFEEVLRLKAERIAAELGRPIEKLALLHYHMNHGVWLPFRVEFEDCGGGRVRAIHDSRLSYREAECSENDDT